MGYNTIDQSDLVLISEGPIWGLDGFVGAILGGFFGRIILFMLRALMVLLV